MTKKIFLTNALICNEGEIYKGSVLIEGNYIKKVFRDEQKHEDNCEIIDLQGNMLIPGVIDCHVHFREPGLTHKADLHSETIAAVAGGITSFMEMPNTKPQTVTLELLEQKMQLASEKSLANYSFFLGATNDNIKEIENANPKDICGVKVFFGASTGNMLVDNANTLEEIFKKSPLPIAVHAEAEDIVKANTDKAKAQYGDDIPVELHPTIRSSKACYIAAKQAIALAEKYDTRLHITHLTTKEEVELLANRDLSDNKRITAETCPHYLYFNETDYKRLGTLLKVNPAVKSRADQQALLKSLLDNTVDIISTDNAPHLLEEKQNKYVNAPSGTPLVQHALMSILKIFKENNIGIERVVEKMCHAPALCYNVEKRGFIREGYFADLVVLDIHKPYTVTKENILYKCGWSIFEGETFPYSIKQTFINGKLIYDNGKIVAHSPQGMRLHFER